MKTVLTVTWQRGEYESGRSLNHLTKDRKRTSCGKVIPQSTSKVNVWFNEVGHECAKCWQFHRS